MYMRTKRGVIAFVIASAVLAVGFYAKQVRRAAAQRSGSGEFKHPVNRVVFDAEYFERYSGWRSTIEDQRWCVTRSESTERKSVAQEGVSVSFWMEERVVRDIEEACETVFESQERDRHAIEASFITLTEYGLLALPIVVRYVNDTAPVNARVVDQLFPYVLRTGTSTGTDTRLRGTRQELALCVLTVVLEQYERVLVDGQLVGFTCPLLDLASAPDYSSASVASRVDGVGDTANLERAVFEAVVSKVQGVRCGGEAGGSTGLVEVKWVVGRGS